MLVKAWRALSEYGISAEDDPGAIEEAWNAVLALEQLDEAAPAAKQQHQEVLDDFVQRALSLGRLGWLCGMPQRSQLLGDSWRELVAERMAGLADTLRLDRSSPDFAHQSSSSNIYESLVVFYLANR